MATSERRCAVVSPAEKSVTSPSLPRRATYGSAHVAAFAATSEYFTLHEFIHSESRITRFARRHRRTPALPTVARSTLHSRRRRIAVVHTMPLS